MSYDISIWSVKPIDFREPLPEGIEWDVSAGSACHSGDGWQIIINTSSKLEVEDVPEEAQQLLPGIENLTLLNLEPIHAPAAAKRLFDKVAKHLALSLTGVIEDQQKDTFKMPSGMKRFTAPSRDKRERFSIIEMSWWIAESPILHEGGFVPIFQYFKTNLPEAYPRRYGKVEPPEFKLEEMGEEHFYDFIESMRSEFIGPVLKTRRPVTGVAFNITKNWGFRRWSDGKDHFYSSTFNISFDSSVLSQPGWDNQLKRTFRDLSKLLKPFYGDVRTLHGYIYARGSYWVNKETENHPVGPFNGIPKRLGQAIVVGEPYLSIWKKARKKGDIQEGLAFIQTDDWSREKDVISIIGKTPAKIAQIEESQTFREHGSKKDYWQYPKLFPFSSQIHED